MQNMSFIEEMGGPQRLDALLPHAVGQLGEALGRLDRDRLAGDARPQRLGLGEELAEDVQVGRLGQPGEVEGVDFRLAVPVKFVWTSKRSMSQTTSSGGFSRASR